MGRPIVLSNGQLFVGLDPNGLVHDFYYPYVGLENLTNARNSHHKIGVWVDKKFSWVDDGTWDISMEFEDRALVGQTRLKSKKLGILLVLQDFVDIKTNSFVRHISITNDTAKPREIRLFMHQVFQISRAGRGDTALYVPDDNYILDYKGRYCLIAGGKFEDGESFDQYAVGLFGIEDKSGTYMDAEDGELSGNPVEHGGVDSVIRFKRKLASNQEAVVDYWVIAADSQNDAQEIHEEFMKGSMDDRLNHARDHWREWLVGNNTAEPDLHRQELEHSLLVIKAHCDERGSVLASGDSSIFNYGRDYYCYCWPRDAAYALWPLIRLGHYDEARRFFEFARDTMHKDGYLAHKYQPDRAIGSTWHPLVHDHYKELAIQEDETAGVIFMLGAFYEASKDRVFIENIFHTFVKPCANFMSRFTDELTGLPHASYDLWEEKFLTSTYTVCTVIAALETAAGLATLVEEPDDAVRWKLAAADIRKNLDKLYHKDGYFIKGLLLQHDNTITYDNTVDISSLYGPYMYSGLPLDDPRILSTAAAVEKRLLNVTPSGGVIRYENDFYFRDDPKTAGNPWIVCSLWMAQYFSAIGEEYKARELLEWSVAHALPSGILGEQFDANTGEPKGVAPLVWSHAEMVNTILDLSTKN